jgi:hypothetical protein
MEGGPDPAWEIIGESSPPEVNLIFPDDQSQWPSDSPLTVHARIFDQDDPLECLLIRLQLDGDENLDWTMDEEGRWRLDQIVHPGEHELVLKAIDPQGEVGRDELQWFGLKVSTDTGLDTGLD